MAAHVTRPKKGKLFRLTVMVSADVVNKIDERAKVLTAETAVPGEVTTRTDVVRRALWEFVK